ncbi:Tuberous sclerosis 2-like protein, partial [Coemansia sp. RSA 2705]
DEKTYSSWARVTLTSKCLLSALEWRVSITDTISDETYAHSAPDTIALVNSLLDLLQSEHTFPSVQRSILAVFLRFHADANLRLYILHSDHDTLLDQRVSLHENARLRLVVQNSCDTEDTLSSGTDRASFPIKRYLDVLAYLFQTNIEVETYSVLCSGLMEQLTNTYLFGVCVDEMQALIGYLISYMRLANYEQDTRTRMPPEEKNRISTFTYGLLASTMPYKDLIGRDHEEMLVIMLGDGLIASSITSETPRICLHALSILMLEIPEVLERKLVGVLLQLAKVYSAAQLSVHLLEFVSSISRNPRLYVNFRGQDYRLLFAVAINYIRFHNNQRRRESSLSGARLAEGGEKGDPRRLSAGASLSGAVDRPTLTDAALSQYVLVMAYQVIDVYYLSLSPALKAETLDHVLVGLLQANYSRSSLDEVNEVCLDMILQNYNRSSEDILSISDVTIKEDFGPVVERHWIQHNGIVTIRAQKEGPMAQIILRSSSGTTSRIVDLPAEVYRKFSERAEKQQPAASLPASPLSDSPSSAFGSMSQSISRGRSIGRSRRLHSMAGPGMSGLHHETDTLPQDSIARLLRGELLSQ